RDTGRSPLFQVMFSLQNTPDVPELKLGSLQLSTVGKQDTAAKFDIAFLMSESPSGIQGTVEYSTDLYNKETIAQMTAHYLNLLAAVAALPACQVGELSMMAEFEEKILLEQF